MIAISHNSPANMAAYNFGAAKTHLAASLTRLSSGNRINSSAEDPSGAAVSLDAASAHSRIADLDVAAESIRLTRANIMQQAGGMAVNQVRVSADSVLTFLR